GRHGGTELLDHDDHPAQGLALSPRDFACDHRGLRLRATGRRNAQREQRASADGCAERTTPHNGAPLGKKFCFLLPTARTVAEQAARGPALGQAAGGGQRDSSVVIGQLAARETHEPIGGAHVVVVGTALATTTDSLGRFTLSGVPGGELSIEIRAVGYASRAWRVTAQPGQTAPRRFELDPLPYELPGVLVKGKQPLASRRYVDFARRRHPGMG